MPVGGEVAAWVLAAVGVALGGGGWYGLATSRAAARKATADAANVEAKTQPEVDAIAVNSLTATAATLSAENARLVARLTAADATIEQQVRTISEQAVTIDKQADTIADYRQQVAGLTEQVAGLQSSLDDVKAKLVALQHAHPGPA